MAEEDLAEGTQTADDGFELDSESGEDLEAAMQEALEAVEKASQNAREKTKDREELELEPSDEGLEVVTEGQEDAEALRDRLIRTLADFDNYRKRVERERADERRYAGFEAFRELLTVLDNLDRAASSEGSAEDLRTGVELILRQLKDLLWNAGVQKVPALGSDFDPRIHEAISRHEDDSVTTPTVSEEMQSGYLMHDRLLRPAIVRVAMPISTGMASEPSEDEEEES